MTRVLLLISSLSLSSLLAGCNCGGAEAITYPCTYRGGEQTLCYECPSSSAANSCVELGPSRAGCNTTPVACPS